MAKLNSKTSRWPHLQEATLLHRRHSTAQDPTIHHLLPRAGDAEGTWGSGGWGASCLPHQAPLLHLQRGPSWPPPNTCPRMHRPVPLFILCCRVSVHPLGLQGPGPAHAPECLWGPQKDKRVAGAGQPADTERAHRSLQAQVQDRTQAQVMGTCIPTSLFTSKLTLLKQT